MKMMVAGVTGYVGGSVAKAAREKGLWVRGLTRDAGRLKVPEDVDDVFVGQATDAKTLRGLCDGVDVAFASIGITTFARKPNLWEIDYKANIKLFEEAQRAGVKHYIFVSTLKGPEMARVCPVAEAREKVADIISTSGMDYTIYRPTGFYNDMKYLFKPIAKKGVARIIGNPDVTINPLSGLDFGEEVVRALEASDHKNAFIDVGGPKAYTRREIAEVGFAALGTPVKIKVQSAGIVKLVAYCLRPFNYNVYSLLRFMHFAMTTPDMTGAHSIGRRSLEDHFRELVKEYKETGTFTGRAQVE